ncbi:MAG: hypothetical protein K6E91_07455 [Butyrivibrio sp.]|nr:hypothetical protein [Butyrivibrio sp.]
MKMKKILWLSACTAAVILAAGCGKNENNTGRTTNNRNNVQAVLEQGMSDSKNENKTESDKAEPDIPGSDKAEPDIAESDIPEQNASDAAGKLQSITPGDALPDSVSKPVTDTSGSKDKDYVDLTALSSTMVYSEVYNMMYYPENYVGKTVKMSGLYAVYHDESTDRYYHACIISDATACCSQGIEFELTDDYKYPDDYPEEGDQICVEGLFDTYKEGEYTYCTLRNSRMQD